MTIFRPTVDSPIRRERMWRPAARLITLIALAISLAHPARADSVTVSIPSFLNFNITDVARSTTGSPSPFVVAFSNAVLNPGESVRISVEATAAQLTAPAGASIPVSNVSWTAANAVNGTGSGGTLRSDAYSQVLQGNPDAVSGSVNLTWSSAAPGSGVRAGSHTLGLSWKIEAVSP
jgi:hypothetical protein